MNLDLALSVNNRGFTTNLPLNHGVSSLKDVMFPSLHLSLLNKECTGQRQPLVELASPPTGLRGPFPFSPPFLSFQGPEAKPGVQATPEKAVTGSLGQPGLAPILWPHFQFLITYLFGQSLNHVGLA